MWSETLLEPYRLNTSVGLKNRMVMAPMTRCMADEQLVPSPEAAAYYSRRAAVGLIVTEGTLIRPDALGYPRTPGIFTDAQIQAWSHVSQEVHKAGGVLFMQLWHVGRVSHREYLNGSAPIAPSAVALSGPVSRSPGLEYGEPRALEKAELPELVEAFAQAAANARTAGCDGVELHAANGYLLDQFLHGHTNLRTDEYGGSVENMIRFVLEVVDAVCARIGSERTGIRLSPGAYHFMEGQPGDAAVFRALLAELAERSLAYVHTGIFDDSMEFDYLRGGATEFLRRNYAGCLVGCGSYTPNSAARAIAAGGFDLAAFGRPFIANPDLVERIRSGAELTPYDPAMLATLD